MIIIITSIVNSSYLSILECNIDAHCEHDKVCINNTCLDPCANIRCIDNEWCKTKHHVASCTSKFTLKDRKE